MHRLLCVRLHGVVNVFFDVQKHVYLVLEYASSGALYKRLRKEGHFDEITAAQQVASITNAIAHLHARHVIHRDIKVTYRCLCIYVVLCHALKQPENILYDEMDQPKLADFGLSIHAPEPYNRRKSLCGTKYNVCYRVLLNFLLFQVLLNT